MFAQPLGVFEEIFRSRVGAVQLGLDFVTADVHGIEMRLEHAEFLSK